MFLVFGITAIVKEFPFFFFTVKQGEKEVTVAVDKTANIPDRVSTVHFDRDHQKRKKKRKNKNN